MIQVVIRFLRLDVVSEHPMVYWGLGFVWLLLMITAFSSIRSLGISGLKKWVWFLVVLLFPILGLAIYSIFCLTRGNWTFLKAVFSQPRVAKTVEPK